MRASNRSAACTQRDEALAALAIAKHNFERVSFDLIYARQGQTLGGLARRAHAARSATRRTISRSISSPSRQARRSPRSTPLARSQSRTASKPKNSISSPRSFAIPRASPPTKCRTTRGLEPSSRHNLLYWRGHDYAGVGPGAHSRITQDDGKHAIAIRKSPEAWLASGRRLRPRHRAGRALEPAKLGRRISAHGLAPRRRHRRDAAQSHRWAEARRCAAATARGARPGQANPRPAAGDRHRTPRARPADRRARRSNIARR